MTTTLAKRETTPASRPIEYMTPRVDLHQNADQYVLEVEMPGVAKDGVEVTVEDGKLSIIGHRRAVGEAGRAVYRETNESAYRRVFDLDPSIDVEKVGAQIEQGLLTVTLRKVEAAKPRKIEVA